MNFPSPLSGARWPGSLPRNGSRILPDGSKNAVVPIFPIYLPHLDYDLQRYGPEDLRVAKALAEIDQVAGDLIDDLEKREITPILLSEYGITKVNQVIYPNREFRHQGWLSLKDEFDGETLDCGGSKAFALTDHQIAHVYVQGDDPQLLGKVRSCLESMDGVDMVLQGKEREKPV